MDIVILLGIHESTNHFSASSPIEFPGHEHWPHLPDEHILQREGALGLLLNGLADGLRDELLHQLPQLHLVGLECASKGRLLKQ